MKRYIAPRIEVIELQSESLMLTASANVNTKHDSYTPGQQLNNRYDSGWDSSAWSLEAEE